MNKNYKIKTVAAEESLFDEVNLKPLSEFLAKFVLDALRQSFNDAIASQNTGGDSDD